MPAFPWTPPVDCASLAVVGLHLSGQPLNGQLLDLGARLRGRFRTASCYRLFSIRREGRHFPGLVRQTSGGGPVEVEVWDLTWPALGEFLSKVKPPLVIGTVELATGEPVKGFLCEAHALTGGEAEDITAHGGWLAFKASLPA
jgi:allophanate hydrolase